MSQPPKDAERLIHEALTQLGWEADPKKIADRVSRLNIGLPREDEFSIVCTWLGRCELIHKLDQKQTPSKSVSHYQVPDLFASFRYENTTIQVLIEVKTSKENTLSFRPDYLLRLKNYAELLHLPILIAWKHLGIWVLFDICHLKKATQNFNINFEAAIRENLLGVLAGDFAYSLSVGAGVHFRFRKDELISETKKDDITEQQWNAIIEDVWFTDGEGHRREFEHKIQSLFLSWSLELEEIHTATHVTTSHIARDAHGLFAHMALVRLLEWQLPSANINWRLLLGESPVLHGIGDFEQAIGSALKQQVVHHVIHQRPITSPAFLAAS